MKEVLGFLWFIWKPVLIVSGIALLVLLFVPHR
jgi:hypothetical protein